MVSGGGGRPRGAGRARRPFPDFQLRPGGPRAAGGRLPLGLRLRRGLALVVPRRNGLGLRGGERSGSDCILASPRLLSTLTPLSPAE